MNKIIPMHIAVQLETGYGKSARRRWLQLPTTKKQFEQIVRDLDPYCFGVTINHYAARVPSLYRDLLAETSLSNVNHLAVRIKNLSSMLKNCVDFHILGSTIAETQKGEFTSFGYLYRNPDKSNVTKNRHVPVALDLKGKYGEDLYGELEFEEYVAEIEYNAFSEKQYEPLEKGDCGHDF